MKNMEELQKICEAIASWVLLPATAFGAGGAVIHAARNNKGWRQILFEGGGGLVVANMAGPLVTLHSPEQWHYTLYFLMGWGGLELVGRVYEVAVAILEQRLRGKVG